MTIRDLASILCTDKEIHIHEVTRDINTNDLLDVNPIYEEEFIPDYHWIDINKIPSEFIDRDISHTRMTIEFDAMYNRLWIEFVTLVPR